MAIFACYLTSHLMSITDQSVLREISRWLYLYLYLYPYNTPLQIILQPPNKSHLYNHDLNYVHPTKYTQKKDNIKNVRTKLTLTHSPSLLNHIRRSILFGSPAPDLPTSPLHPSVRGRDRGSRSVEDAWNAVPGKPSTRTPGARSREYRAGNDAAG